MNAWKESQEWTIFPSHQGPALDKSDLAGTLHVIQSSLKFQWDHLTWHEWWCVDIAWDLPWFSFMVDLHLWFDLIWAKPAHIKKRWKNYDQLDTFVQSQSNMFNQIKQTVLCWYSKTRLDCCWRPSSICQTNHPPKKTCLLRTWSEAAAAAESAPNQFCTCWKLNIILSNSLEHLFRMNTWIIKIWHTFLCLLCELKKQIDWNLFVTKTTYHQHSTWVVNIISSCEHYCTWLPLNQHWIYVILKLQFHNLKTTE